MSRTSSALSALAAASGVLCLLVSAGLGAALAADFGTRDVLPPSTVVAGVDVGGLARNDAELVLRERVEDPLLAPVWATFDGGAASVEASGLVRLDLDGMLDAALAPNRAPSLDDRVLARVRGERPRREIRPSLTVDEEAVRRWVASVARRADVRPVDATVTLEGTRLRLRPSSFGRTMDRAAAARIMKAALLSGRKSVVLPVRKVPPKVDESDLGKTIVVSIPARRLWLYNGGRLEKTYGVAVGTPGYPTPAGDFAIVNKRYLPTWRNPGSDWAKDMPKEIGPGPSNPLGTRALDLDAPGIRIHGTTKDGSIGTAASHGCMRMHRWDIEDLYPRVPLGTRVLIRR